MKKVLIVATVVKHHVMTFHLPYLEWFQSQGYETHVCANNDYDIKEDCNIPYCDKFHELPFERAPFNSSNITAYKQLKTIIETNNYDIIHCHTPVGGFLARLAARRSRRIGTKVIYTAHGFHFFKGAPLINWLIYYPIEKILAKFTDCLITTNAEDFELIKRSFQTNNKFVNGVGVDLDEFIPQDYSTRLKLREKFGYSRTDFILIFPAELSKRKNQKLLLNVVSQLKITIPNVKLLLPGIGSLFDTLKSDVISLGISEQVEFLGYRKDLHQLFSLADVAVSSSTQEGLPVNIMMAMATGLPCVVTGCRGNVDLIDNEKNGFVVGLADVDGFAQSITKLYLSENLRNEYGKNNLKKIVSYSIENTVKQTKNIYVEILT